MQIMIATAVLALFMAPHSASAQDRAARDARDPEVSTSKAYTAEESATMARAARAKAGAQERVWDRKMKIITRGICTGC
jgi:hypothetical protein